MGESRILGSDPGSRLDAIRWGPRFPRFGASVFLAAVAGALIPAGVAYVNGRDRPASPTDLSSGADGTQAMIPRNRALPRGRRVDLHASTAKSFATPSSSLRGETKDLFVKSLNHAAK
jgi:hypothetical protein